MKIDDSEKCTGLEEIQASEILRSMLEMKQCNFNHVRVIDDIDLSKIRSENPDQLINILCKVVFSDVVFTRLKTVRFCEKLELRHCAFEQKCNFSCAVFIQGADFDSVMFNACPDVPPSNHTSCYEISRVMKEVMDAEEEAFS